MTCGHKRGRPFPNDNPGRRLPPIRIENSLISGVNFITERGNQIIDSQPQVDLLQNAPVPLVPVLRLFATIVIHHRVVLVLRNITYSQPLRR